LGQTKLMLSAAEKGLDVINPSSETPTGLLRITMPAFVTQTDLMDVIDGFLHAYPKIELNLDFSDQPRALIKDGFDLGIRVGWLKDSDLLTQNIGKTDRWLIASTRYVSDKPMPEHPSELGDWDWVRFAVRQDQLEFTSPDGEQVRVSGRSKVTVNSADAVHQLALRGFGITALPVPLAQEGIKNGDLVQLLPEWTIPAVGLHVVWPSQARRENLTMIFVRFLKEANNIKDGNAARGL
jgi:DNA-binding transcriptional LysR family regulator